jgi:hypothetical protein
MTQKRPLLAPLTNYCPSVFLPFLLADPQLMESSQTRQDAAAQPSTVPALCRITWRMYLDVREMATELVIKAFGEASKQTTPTSQDNIAHDDLTQFDVAGADGIAD